MREVEKDVIEKEERDSREAFFKDFLMDMNVKSKRWKDNISRTTGKKMAVKQAYVRGD